MFSQTAEYALRVVVYLASLEGKPATIPQIAAATRVPQGYLAKVMQSLGRAGLIRSQRGLHGGSVLARPAKEMTVYDAMQAVDPIQRITSCPLGIESHGINLCPLHRRLDQAIAMVQKAFQNSSIAEMVSSSSDSGPLCPVPLPLPMVEKKKVRSARRVR
jgi:Rrf2 family protein